jgi:Spy/CpxP family protein refolding chaperone
MTSKTKLLSTLALVAVLALGGAAAFAGFHQGAGGPGRSHHRAHFLHANAGEIPPQMLGHLKEALDLTDDQVAEAQKLFATFHETAKPQFEALRQGKETVDKLLADGATAQAVGEAMIANYKTKKDLEAAHDRMFTDFSESLSAEQREKLEEMHKHMKFRFEAGPGFVHGGPPPFGRHHGAGGPDCGGKDSK